MIRRAPLVALTGLTTALVVGGCSEVNAASTTHYIPAALSTVAGSDGVKQVTFTREAAGRIRLRTAPVRADRGMLVLPSEAVIYDPTGRSWVYTAASPLTFVRAQLSIATGNARDTWVTSGPPVGTEVVTTGAAEVYGAEFEVGH